MRRALQPLRRLRRQLTAWYAGTIGLTLILLGGGLYAAIRAQLAHQLHRSLREATAELGRAARIREVEASAARGHVVDAVEELYIPDRTLYLLDTAGAPVTGARPAPWMVAVARRAMRTGDADDEIETPDARTLSLHAARFRLGSGQPLIAVAVADEVELTDRYAALIAAFGGAAVAAVVLVAAGGYFLVRKSTDPIERSLEFTQRFVADAAHELRTPIAVLRTKAEVALQQPRPAEAYINALHGIEREAERLGRIVDDLLMLARADAGERPVARDRLFLDDIVIEAATSVRPLAESSGVELSVDEFQEAPILGDAALVRELVVVLLDNAIQFTPRQGTVRVSVTADGAPTVVVEDSGCGISASELTHVFDRFYRGTGARPRAGGAGLGLSIARWAAEVHGAALTLSSAEGVGTRASVAFPPVGAG